MYGDVVGKVGLYLFDIVRLYVVLGIVVVCYEYKVVSIEGYGVD